MMRLLSSFDGSLHLPIKKLAGGEGEAKPNLLRRTLLQIATSEGKVADILERLANIKLR